MAEPSDAHGMCDQDDPHDIRERYLENHRNYIDLALQEIENGQKESCWSWFILPTPPYIVDGIERGSPMNQYYALRGDDAAKAFLTFDHGTLRTNYLNMVRAIQFQLRQGHTLKRLLGSLDCTKAMSSFQLFERIGQQMGDEELAVACREVLDWATGTSTNYPTLASTNLQQTETPEFTKNALNMYGKTAPESSSSLASENSKASSLHQDSAEEKNYSVATNGSSPAESADDPVSATVDTIPTQDTHSSGPAPISATADTISAEDSKSSGPIEATPDDCIAPAESNDSYDLRIIESSSYDVRIESSSPAEAPLDSDSGTPENENVTDSPGDDDTTPIQNGHYTLDEEKGLSVLDKPQTEKSFSSPEMDDLGASSPRALVVPASTDETDDSEDNSKLQEETAPVPPAFATEPSSPEGEGGMMKVVTTYHARMIHGIQRCVIRVLQWFTSWAIRFPRLTLLLLSLVAVGLLVAGLLTNFTVETSTSELWPPRTTQTYYFSVWMWTKSYFTYDPMTVEILVHKNGETDGLLGKTGVQRVFEIQEVFSSVGSYKAGCAFAEEYGDDYNVGRCRIVSVASFWNASMEEFEASVDTDEDAIDYLSSTTYPNGILVDVDAIMGKTVRDNSTGILISAESYSITFRVPWSYETLEFEEEALARMLELRQEWVNRGDEFVMEILSYSSYNDEFLRAILADLWLLPLAFCLVAGFTIFFAFGKWHKVKSQALLGLGAVVTIAASLTASFGVLFWIGVPFTTNTVMVPFLMFGIGLDDSFVIYGSYYRRAHISDVEERIQSTMEDVGVSIFLTSLTSILAFFLGSFSQIPAIRWLCLYAYPCIGIDFLYQITFFIALIVLEERRIKQGRMDCCTCIKVEAATEDSEVVSSPVSDDNVEGESDHVADRFMTWWAHQLLKPRFQGFALIAFLAMLGSSIYFATQLHQAFDFTGLVPKDSYVKDYYNAVNSFTSKEGYSGYAIFRNVVQSDPWVQEQMELYVHDLVERGNVDEPVYFWLRDFKLFSAELADNSTFQNRTFNDQIEQFLAVDTYAELYNDHIARDHKGRVRHTRVPIHINVDIQSAKAATDTLINIRGISASQLINQGTREWSFFTYAGEYHLSEFYRRVVNEMIWTSVMSVVAVAVVAIFFIPHWTAVFFVVWFICCLYVNLLGFLNISGVQINPISYVVVVMAIGMMIDYIMHILMRYYECKGSRRQRVRETMSSIGSSVFLGAASTLLGMLALAFSTSDILRDVFKAVVGLIVLGIVNGLIFLPVALDMFGPEEKTTDVLVIGEPAIVEPVIDEPIAVPQLEGVTSFVSV